MKNTGSFILLLLLILGLNHCNKEETVPGTGRVSFSHAQQTLSGGRSEKTGSPKFVLLSIKDAKGNEVESNRKLALYNFNTSYISEELSLNVGTYTLTQFMVANETGKIIYASPLQGSDLAKKITDPLPVDFKVTEQGTTTIVPQVLKVNNDPESFGYTRFGFEIIDPAEWLKVKQITRYSDSDTSYLEYSYNNEGALSEIKTFLKKQNTSQRQLAVREQYFYDHGTLLRVDIDRYLPTFDNPTVSFNTKSYRYYYKNATLSMVEILFGEQLAWYSLITAEPGIMKQSQYNYLDDLQYTAEWTIGNGNVTTFNRYYSNGDRESTVSWEYDTNSNPDYLIHGFREFTSPLYHSGFGSRNNAIAIHVWQGNSSIPKSYTSTYTYNQQGYPETVKTCDNVNKCTVMKFQYD